MSNQVPPGPGQPPAGAEPPYGPYAPQVPPPGVYQPGGSQGVPPPPGPYVPGAPQPPTGQPSYEPYGQQSSYGPAPQPGPGGYGQQPPGAQMPAPYGAYGPYPGPPKSGSGGKIVAIVASAVVVVGLIVGGVLLLTRNDDSPVADSTTSSATSTEKKTKTPTPKPTTATPTPKPDSDGPSAAEIALAEAAFPAAEGYGPVDCDDYALSLFDDTEFAIYCFDDSFELYKVYKWPDSATASASILSYGAYRNETGYYTEGTWAGGPSFIRNDSSYTEIRCYTDVPLCLEPTSVNNAQQAEDKFSHIVFADAAGVEALKALIAGEGV